MDPDDVTTRRKCNSCSVCNLNCQIQKPTGFLNDGRALYIKYGWICTNCSSASSIHVAGNSEELPFHDADTINSVSSASSTQNDEIEPTSPFPNGLKFIHQNVNGLRSKFIEYRNLLTCDLKIAAFAITETKLKICRDDTNQFEIDNYELFRFDREGDKEGGGTLLYINKYFESELVYLSLLIPKYVECTVVRLKSKGIKSILVIVIYVPPDLVNDDFFNFLSSLHKFLSKYSGE